MSVAEGQIRTKAFSTDNRAAFSGSFLSPLLYMLHMEEAHVPEQRRQMLRETPPWFLFFKGSYHHKAREFLHQSICTLITLESNPLLSTSDSFHSETGVLTKHLVEYLRSVDDADKMISFVDGFRSYVLGDRKRMPNNISFDLHAYQTLKEAAKTDYTKRLITEHNGGNVSPKTQDYVMLFKMPLFALLESVFCAVTDEDVVKAIEEYRQQ